MARRRHADPVLSRTDRPSLQPDRPDRREHGADGNRTRDGGAAHTRGGKAVVVDAYDDHEEFTAWLRSAGFEAQRAALSDAAAWLGLPAEAPAHGAP